MFEINFGQYMKRENGTFNVEEAVQRFTSEATNFVSLQEKTEQVCKDAVEKVFTDAGRARLNKGAVVSLAMLEVGYTVKNHAEVKSRVEELIDNDPRYQIVMGGGKTGTGGLQRLSDEELAVFNETGKTPKQIELEARAAKKNATAATV